MINLAIVGLGRFGRRHADAVHFPKREIENTIYELVRERQGCVSAEHGIGIRKKAFLAYSRSPDEIRLMQTIKQALDPKGILNAGKVLPDRDSDRANSAARRG